MASITNQLSGLLSLKWVRKYLQKDRTTSLHREGSSQKCDCQCSRYKVLGSGSSNGSASGTIDDQTEPVRPHEEAYQYHQPSAMIWENPKPGLEETNESINPCLKKQHPAFLFPTKLELLGPPLPPPPNKPLPEIPTQARPHKVPDKIGRNRQDPPPPTWNLANTTQRTTANYSPFPKLAMVPPPRGSSLHHSSRPHRKTHKSQRISCANTTVTKQLHRHVAEPYQDTSMERKNAVKELGDVPIKKPLPRDTRSPSLEKRVIGSEVAPCDGRDSITLRSSRSLNYLSMHKCEPCPRFTKKSVPNLRRAAKYEPLQLHQYPEAPRFLRLTQPY
ncbi:hypothetical protein BFJ63_vAg14816 [Fusarium oxysporum f. sp. narcissi]|uniref:Uncharacterized protein n=1 Tax=Fusarium oxysporum f. sp. narcissi TaxID=451672 RepID=A0A4Q2V697_FUSOX|nr:hypothetical protein BFJ63_vAg14816 [Fusarium oxysporum f. sp. narcissi]